MCLRREPSLPLLQVFIALPAESISFAAPKEIDERKGAFQIGRPVIDDKNLIIARSFRNRVLPLCSSAIPNETLLLRTVSF